MISVWRLFVVFEFFVKVIIIRDKLMVIRLNKIKMKNSCYMGMFIFMWKRVVI